MGHLFGSSGIRGPYPAHVNIDLAARLGRAAAIDHARILIGHDVRLSSPLLSAAFTAGALSMGAQVYRTGGATTPSIAYAGREADLAISVTASHNPPPDNGFKFWNPDGSAWDTTQEERFEGHLGASRPLPEWKDLAPVEGVDATGRHLAALADFVGPVKGRAVLDAGNGAATYLRGRHLSQSGIEVETIFDQPDGTFPNRPSEPDDHSLTRLKEECRRRQRWGIAHDGDADRMVAVRPDGRLLGADATIMALALLLDARRIVTPVDCSLALKQALPHVQWEHTRVGDAAVSARLKEGGGDLGAETSGTYVVPGFDFAPDGPLAALLLLRAVEQGFVQEADRRLRPSERRSLKMPLGDVGRPELRRRLLEAEAPGARSLNREDGLRADYEEGWFLVRPSGTEPVARVTAEGVDAAAADRMLERGQTLLKRLLAS